MAILDDLGLSVELAVSLTRHLRAAYTGPTVRLEDSSGTPQQADFYPDGAGGIAQGSAVGDAPAVWGTPPFKVVTIYDQSGNGVDFDTVVNAGVLVDTVDPGGRWGATGLQIQTSSLVTLRAVLGESLLWSVAVHDDIDAASGGGSQGVLFGSQAPTLHGMQYTWWDTTAGAVASKMRVVGRSDNGFDIAGSDLIEKSQSACWQMLKPTAGTAVVSNLTTDDMEIYTEDALDGTRAASQWDIRDWAYTINLPLGDADTDILFFEGVILSSTSDISDADRSALAQDQMAYYETRDYVPGEAGLVATPVTAEAATIGTPGLGQSHEIDADPLSASATTISTPAIGQAHALATGGIATQAATIGTPAIGQAHAFTTAGIAAQAATIGSPAIGQHHSFTNGGLSAANAALDEPSLISLGEMETVGATVTVTDLGVAPVIVGGITAPAIVGGITAPAIIAA